MTLQFLPYWIRAALLLGIGIFLFAYGSYRVVRALLGPFTESGEEPLVDLVYRRRLLARGPRVVAIGGGTGLSTLLRGLKEHSANITAIVSVADDGGSSGRLREQLGIAAVGDIRNCLAALAETEPAMARLLQYRFTQDEGNLAGHAVGNLLIAAMNAIDGGDFEEAIRHMNRVLAVRGRVVPASGTPLVLHARLRDGTLVEGQSRIARMRAIESVWLTPADVHASRDALAAIAEADLVVVGPGSLYTSILPPLLVPEIRAALATTPALRVFACNVATQAGETEGYDLADHVEALVAHLGPVAVDIVLANNHLAESVPDLELGVPVKLRWPPRSGQRGARVSSSTTWLIPRIDTITIPSCSPPRSFASSSARAFPAGDSGLRDPPDRTWPGRIAILLRLCAPSWPPLSPRAPATGRPKLPGWARPSSGVIGRPLPASWSACSARTTSTRSEQRPPACSTGMEPRTTVGPPICGADSWSGARSR